MTLIELIVGSVGPPVAIFPPPGRGGVRHMAIADDLGVGVVEIRHPEATAYVSGMVAGLFGARLRDRLEEDQVFGRLDEELADFIRRNESLD